MKKSSNKPNFSPALAKLIFLESFHNNYTNTSELIGEVVDEIITDLELNYTIRIKNESRLFKILKYEINNSLTEWIIDRIREEKSLRLFIKRLEKINIEDSRIRKYYTLLLLYNVSEFIDPLKLFALLHSSKNNLIINMAGLDIYTPYVPTGRKISDERKLIYQTIPIMHQKLISENAGKEKKGISDKKTAVNMTIKLLEKESLIEKYRHNTEKVYNSWIKSKPIAMMPENWNKLKKYFLLLQ
jgi:hypothetical protein